MGEREREEKRKAVFPVVFILTCYIKYILSLLGLQIIAIVKNKYCVWKNYRVGRGCAYDRKPCNHSKVCGGECTHR